MVLMHQYLNVNMGRCILLDMSCINNTYGFFFCLPERYGWGFSPFFLGKYMGGVLDFNAILLTNDFLAPEITLLRMSNQMIKNV